MFGGKGRTAETLRAATASHLTLTWELVLEVLGLLTHNEQATATAIASSVPVCHVCLSLSLSLSLCLSICLAAL